MIYIYIHIDIYLKILYKFPGSFIAIFGTCPMFTGKTSKDHPTAITIRQAIGRSKHWNDEMTKVTSTSELCAGIRGEKCCQNHETCQYIGIITYSKNRFPMGHCTFQAHGQISM